MGLAGSQRGHQVTFWGHTRSHPDIGPNIALHHCGAEEAPGPRAVVHGAPAEGEKGRWNVQNTGLRLFLGPVKQGRPKFTWISSLFSHSKSLVQNIARWFSFALFATLPRSQAGTTIAASRLRVWHGPTHEFQAPPRRNSVLRMTHQA